MTTRRDFIKALGGALGAVVLTSCGSGGKGPGGPPVVPIPNGYRFFRVFSTGDPLPGGTTLTAMPGAVMLNDRNEIFFYGSDNAGANGFYELLMDFNGSMPVIQQRRKVVREGDTLKDSKAVSRINIADANNHGSFAAVLQTNDDLPGLYLEREKQGLEPVAGFLTALPGGNGKFGAAFGDVDIHTNNDLLFVAHYAPDDTVQGHQGLFYLPGGEINQNGAIVTSTRDLIPDAGGFLTGMGLVDMHDNGNYVLQAYGMTSDTLDKLRAAKAGETLSAEAGSLLVQGSVKDPFSKTLKSTSSSLKVRSAAAAAEIPAGEIKYGPRIGGNNNPAYVIHVSGTHLVLYYNGKQVVSTGSLSPLDARIESFSSPVVGSDGLLYYQAVTSHGMELIAYNGAESRTMLSRTDRIDDSGIKSFFFGFMPDQVDSSGRIVLTGVFEDGTMSIIVGIPI